MLNVDYYSYGVVGTIHGPRSAVQIDPQTETSADSETPYDPNVPRDFSIAPEPACVPPEGPQRRSGRLHTQVSSLIHRDVPPCDSKKQTKIER